MALTKNTKLYGAVKKDGSVMAVRALTEETFEFIVEAVGLGAPLYMAAHAGGIESGTLHRYLREARVLEIQGLTEDDDIRIRLMYAIQKARAQRAVEALERIKDAAKNPQHWTAAAWYLERVYPESFGRQDRAPLDWREELRKLGKSPEQLLEAMVSAAMEDNVVDGTAEEV